ncbi:membrane associated rhomboid family serine protease [Tenacibaculum skagerrakense]|uniref:Membrane associated rhomboid family serine protease n=1 Tax=Tenacibaculum skagerrakense TaxID=186571 RepID=A0A4R2NWY2_9FLAO|nr:rhomboid family intramembrane serine protease [Tenacibaculum skagerrakense]TCP26683.1 membrane associated rhomboid family serine protease [Tenacibaculum skagerrakense]
MNQNNEFKVSNEVFTIPLVFVFLIWFIYWVEIKFGFNFNKFGVLPRTLSGFKGVFFTHFIHGDIKHLFNNTVPLTVLLMSLMYFYRAVAFKVLLYGGLLTGFFTWIIGRESYHIGASGIVYLLFSFIFFSGVIKRHYRLVAMSLITIFLYGSMIWYVFPIKEGMSWEGHLSGFLTGLLFAIIYRKHGTVREKHVFTKTDFDDMFDESGNYIPQSPEEVINEETPSINTITYKYIYKDSQE